ncbi:MAG: MATE family efflux transporter [Roseburia sp.]|nr:MATE family efflux transporter [Roseburia sp.]
MKIEKQLRKFVIPNVFAMLGMSCYILADTFFISVVEGTNGMTALNLILPVYGLIYAIGAMTGVGSAIRYSLCKASGAKGAEDYFSNAVIWDILIGLLFVLLGIVCPQTVLKLMGADEVILGVGTSYLRVAFMFAPFFMMNYAFTAFTRNDNAPKTAMAATLASSFFNILFDYIFMFPMNRGMTGAALATGLSPIVSMLVCLTHFFSGSNRLRFRIMVPSVRKLLEACKVGMVAFVGEMASGITTMAFNFILLGLGGNVAVAAYGVIANIALVGTAIFNGVAQGLQPLVSEAHGKGNAKTAERLKRHSLQIALLLAALLVAVVWIFAEVFVEIFNGEHSREMAAYAIPGLRIYFAGFFPGAVNLVRAGYFSAIGLARESSVIALLRGIVAIVALAFLLSKLGGVTGVWFSFAAAELFTLAVTVPMGRRHGAAGYHPGRSL